MWDAMNTEHARTFLAVADAGSFVAAAERLHVTQSTVSARIRTLEDTLRCRLFVRNKSGASLTNEGGRFLKHANVMVRTFEQARQDIGLPKHFRARVNIGARIGLWDGLMLDWFSQMQCEHPDVSFRAESAFEPEIMQGLVDGRLEFGIMYTPQHRPNLKLQRFMTDQLVMVTSGPDGVLKLDQYVHVDWGPEFDAQLAASFAELPGPATTVNIGWLGIEVLGRRSGCGYFPRRLIERHLQNGSLSLVENAPTFELPAWILVREDRNHTLLDPMIANLQEMAGR
jgi:DNA-binding transcriptional LysR family regulator